MNHFFTTNTLAPVTLLGLGGSTRATSSNEVVLRKALDHAEDLGAGTNLIGLHASQFPLLNRDRPFADYPDDVAQLVMSVSDADGFVLCSPTYHGSMSGAFKNALDLLIYGNGEYFDGKPVGLVVLGGANAAPVLDMMTTTVHALKGVVVPNRVSVPHGVVSDGGEITDPQVTARIQRMVSDVLRLARALRSYSQESAEISIR